MTRIVHLSDLHFGAHDEHLVEAVERKADELKPELVVISGDFTQRARTEQFREACEFLETLRDRGHEVLGVPGNHDVPLYDVLRRFLSPLARYRRFIDEKPVPVRRASRRRGARHQHRALADLQGRAHQQGSGGLHPRDLFAHAEQSRCECSSRTIRCSRSRSVESSNARSVARSWRSTPSRNPASICCLRATIITHRARTLSDLVTRAGGVLVVQAGTATSTRVREQQQSFNVIDIDGGSVTVTIWGWTNDSFSAKDSSRYEWQAGNGNCGRPPNQRTDLVSAGRVRLEPGHGTSRRFRPG